MGALAMLDQSREGWQLASFEDLMDTLAGCLIVFLVDCSFEVAISKEGIRERVASAVPSCLEEVASLIKNLHEGGKGIGASGSIGITSIDTGMLQKRIAAARFLDAEARREDPIWRV